MLAIGAVAAIAGASAGGYTGIAYAEWARLGGARRTEATGLGTALMFFGVTVIPSGFGLAVTRCMATPAPMPRSACWRWLGAAPLCLPGRRLA